MSCPSPDKPAADMRDVYLIAVAVHVDHHGRRCAARQQLFERFPCSRVNHWHTRPVRHGRRPERGPDHNQGSRLVCAKAARYLLIVSLEWKQSAQERQDRCGDCFDFEVCPVRRIFEWDLQRRYPLLCQVNRPDSHHTTSMLTLAAWLPSGSKRNSIHWFGRRMIDPPS